MNPFRGCRGRVFHLRSLLLFFAGVVIGFLLASSNNLTQDCWEIWQRDRDKSPENKIERPPLASATTTEKQLELWEHPTLLNLNNFTWLMNNEAICKLRESDPTDLRVMPILVHTARSSFNERLAIRRTWGALPVYKNWDIRFVFLLGQAERGLDATLNQVQFEEQEKMLQEEQAQYSDLVIGNFIDSYRNLTYKHLMGYKWVLNFCPNAPFVMKIDDDMFIDVMRWLDWRSDDLEKIANDDGAKIPDLYCHTFGVTKPIREPGSKWYVSFEDWPKAVYPLYCSGWAYGISAELMKKIYLASNDRKMLWVDDIFVTGALLEVAKIKFNFKPEVKEVLRHMTYGQKYRLLCEQKVFDGEPVVNVPRGAHFERNMMCLHNKILHDRRNEVLFPSSTHSAIDFPEKLGWDEQSEYETLIF